MATQIKKKFLDPEVISYFDDQIDQKLDSTLKGAVNGLAELDANGKVPTSQLSAVAITDTFVVANEAAMLALTAEKGDVAVRTDLSKTFILAGTDPTVLANWQELLTPTVTDVDLGIAQVKMVTKGGSDVTGTGTISKPFATIGAALASITDASPTKRYLIKVEAGAYTEASALNLKANVFIAGDQKEAVRITAPSYALAADFTGSGDHRSGFSQVILIGACDFNWATVTSAAGKLYFNEVSFSNNVSMNGHNNAIAQAQFDSCIFFGSFTVSGINVGVHSNNFHYGAITLNQHPNGGMATILSTAGGYVGNTVTLNTTVNDFNRRCALFARSFYMGTIVVNGPSSYADVTNDSLPAAGPTVTNGGNVVYINPSASGANTALSNLAFPTAVNNPIMPATTGATNLGDWGKQWAWTFSYVHASSGSEAYFGSYPSAFAPDTTGKAVTVMADLAGLAENTNGGDVNLATAAVTGTGVRGKVTIDARFLDMTAKQIKNVADATDAQDVVTKSQLDAAIGAVAPGIVFEKETYTAAAPLSSIELQHQAIEKSLNVFVGRLALHAGTDYTVSVSAGKTVLTWIGDFAVGGVEAIEVGDKIFVNYAKLDV